MPSAGWPLRKEDGRKLPTTEMRKLRMISGKTLGDGIRNQTIRDVTGVEKIKDFMREQRLRWFGYVERMDDERTPVKAKNFSLMAQRKADLRKDKKKL